MARLSETDKLRYPVLFGAVMLAVAIACNAVAKLAAERAVLPLLRPGADAAGPLRVTNNDGSLSNGVKLRGWDNTAYFATHIGLWMAGCAAAFVALLRVWPAKTPPSAPADRRRTIGFWDFVAHSAPPAAERGRSAAEGTRGSV